MAAHIVKTWIPSNVVVVYEPGYTDAASITFTGFAADSLISLERIGDVFEESEGADGLMDRTFRNAQSYTLNAMLKQTSVTNTLLLQALEAEIAEKGEIVGKITIGGIDGDQTWSASAWIKTDPKKDYNRSMSTREWVFVITEVSK